MSGLRRAIDQRLAGAFGSLGLPVDLARATPSDRPDLADFQCNGDLAAAKQHIPLVQAWVWEMTGLLTTFWPGRGPCLACASLEPPSNRHPALLSPLPGIMGALQALEVLRLLGGLGPALLGRVLIFKGDQFNFTEKIIRPNPQCPVCAT